MTLIHVFARRLKNFAHLLLALIAVFYYGNPSKKLKIIGVTGTDGKTTTSSYIYQLLKLSGKKTALISTVGVFVDNKKDSLGLHVTTPSPFTLNKYLKQFVNLGLEFIVLEVSSHAIDQNRVFGINFEVSTITNITKEHLDYHKNIENYLDTKVRLLKSSNNAILNIDDPFFQKIKNKIKDKKIFTYSLGGKDSDLNYSTINSSQTEDLTDYNKKNLLASLLVLKVLGLELNEITHNIKKLKLPEGRLEYLQKTPFEVIIDFAHTPNAFSCLLPEIRKITHGKIIHVFGSAGGRDKSKRPDMGEISSKYSDVIILTAEDPRGENIHKINSDIRKGIDPEFSLISNLQMSDKKDLQKSVLQINDRKEAIKFALGIARPKDCVLITGKGPEKSMNIGGVEIPWNDIEITKKLLN